MEKKFEVVTFENINISDPFMSKKIEVIRNKMIPYQWDALNDNIKDADKSHAMENLKIAAGLKKGKFYGAVFQDSDFAKWVEAASYSIATHPDEKLEKIVDGAIDIISKAQRPDGYLNTYYILTGIEKRWTNLRDNHELYCAGHMIEAAVAYYNATKKEKFLNVVIKYVDHIDSIFGPEENKIQGYPGHEEIELALIRLYHATKNEKYLKLAKYFIDQRGQKPNYFEKEREKNDVIKDYSFKKGDYTYEQAAIPVREQKKAQGHAVRAVYLYSAMADIANETDEEKLIKACKAIWDNIENKQMYITGGIGQSANGEMFTYDYDLPNDTVYAETCASVGLIFFARRMLELEKNSKYADVIEKALYNTVISGMNLEGTRYFYVNPLEVVPKASKNDPSKKHIKVERQKWFSCACCPPNLARLISSIGSYIYMKKKNDIYVNLYIAGKAEIITENNKININSKSNMPWSGNMKFDIEKENDNDCNVAFRIPNWADEFCVKLNGKEVKKELLDGYLYINCISKENIIELELNMNVKVIRANTRVRENIGKVCVTRGPLVYCLEEPDNGKDLHLVHISNNTKFKEEYSEGMLGGIVSLKSDGYKLKQDSKEEKLYIENAKKEFCEIKLTWIPYYSWANRKPGEMITWVREK